MNAAIRQRREAILRAAQDAALDLRARINNEMYQENSFEDAVSIHEPAISEIALTFEEALREAVAPQAPTVTAYLITSKGE